MTLGGWIFLILSWAVIIGLCVFCFRKVFQLQRSNTSEPPETETEADVLRSDSKGKTS